MALRSFVTAQDIFDSLGSVIFMSLYDDGNTGNALTTMLSSPVLQNIANAHAQAISWLPDIYSHMPSEVPATSIVVGAAVASNTDQIPVLLKALELQFLVVYSWRRRPEFAKQYGVDSDARWKDAIAFAQRIQSGSQRISPTDTPPEATPENIGGASVADGNRIAMSSAKDGSSNLGDW